jgi:hypothetical protein
MWNICLQEGRNIEYCSLLVREDSFYYSTAYMESADDTGIQNNNNLLYTQ